jgi:cytochrome c oxidase subunit 2
MLEQLIDLMNRLNVNMLDWLPEAASTYAQAIDEVFYIIYIITGLAFLLVTVLMFWFLLQFKARPGRTAHYSHGNVALELTWTIVPTLVFLGIFFYSQSTWSIIKYPSAFPEFDVHVRVVAKQFAWEFHYPGPDGEFDTDDDKMFDGDMYVPVNKVVGLTLRGSDVIHSFFVPEFRLKQDILPRRDIPAWFNATKTGRFETPCAELCGPGHSGMKGWVNVYDDAEYQAWVAEQWPPAPREETPVDTGVEETGQEDTPQGDTPEGGADQMDQGDSGQADTVE